MRQVEWKDTFSSVSNSETNKILWTKRHTEKKNIKTQRKCLIYIPNKNKTKKKHKIFNSRIKVYNSDAE